MAVKISGVLKDGTGKPVENCTIQLKARRTSSTVEDVKHDTREAEDVLDVAVAIAEADGEIEPEERKVLEEIAGVLGLRLENPPTFSLTPEGKLTARNADISGAITANTGTLNNVTINENCVIRGKLINSD